MRALEISAPNHARIVERPEPVAATDELLIAPEVVGVCGTDLDILTGRIDPAFVRYPLVIGHEWAGRVVDGSAHIAAGTRVVVEGVIPCGHCERCQVGETNLCLTYDEFGFVRDGAAADLLVVPARLVHPLAPHVSAASGALVEPAAVSLRALERAGVRAGATVLVVGDGTVGLLTARLARLFEPACVVVAGIRPDQRELVERAGVDEFTLAPSGSFDFVIEASGSRAGATTAIERTRRGGTVVMVGFPGPDVPVPVSVDDLVNNDLSVLGSFSYTSAAWSRTVQWLNSGALELDFLVTHTFGLDDWQRAFEQLHPAPGIRGKVQLSIR